MGKIIILRILNSYFQHRWLNLIPIVIMVAAGVANFIYRDTLYISTGVLVVQRETLLASITAVTNDGFSWNTPAQDTATELNDLLKSDSFVRAIIDETSVRDQLLEPGANPRQVIADTRKRMWAGALGYSQVAVSASDPYPEVARELANAAIDKFTQWKINTSHIDSDTAVAFLQQSVTALIEKQQEAQNELKNYLLSHPEPIRGTRPDIEMVEIENLRSSVQFAEDQLSEIMLKEEDARMAYAQVEADVRQTYYLIDAPGLPTKPAQSKKQLALNFGVFVAAGGALSIFLVIGSAVLSHAIWFPLDVQNILDLPVLGVIPQEVSPRKKKRLFGRGEKKQRTPREKKRKGAGAAEAAPTPEMPLAGDAALELPAAQDAPESTEAKETPAAAAPRKKKRALRANGKKPQPVEPGGFIPVDEPLPIPEPEQEVAAPLDTLAPLAAETTREGAAPPKRKRTSKAGARRQELEQPAKELDAQVITKDQA